MLKEYCLSKACYVFKPLAREYNLSCIKDENKVIYYSDKIKFSVYLEDYFEINIVFNSDANNSVYLNDVLVYINDKIENKNYKYNNQVSTESDIDFVLSDAFKFLKIILSMIENDSDFLTKVFGYAKEKADKLYNKYLLKQMKAEFEEKWKAKDYFGYVKIYEKYKSKVSFIDLFLTDLQKKRLFYSRNAISFL